MGIELSLTPTQMSTWPLEPFLDDAVVAAGFTHATPLQPHGLAFGTLKADGVTYSLPRTDLFSSTASSAVPDIAVTTQNIERIFGLVRNALKTETPVLEHKLEDTFPSNVSGLLADYVAITQQPTLLGFMQWFAQSKGVGLLIGSDANNVTFSVMLKSQGPMPSSDVPIDPMDESLQHLGQLVKQQFSEATNFSVYNVAEASQMNAVADGLLRAIVVITDPTSANPIARLDTPLNTSSTVRVHLQFQETDSLFSCANITYDYNQGTVSTSACIAGSLRSTIGSYVGLNEAKQLVLDSTWNLPTNMTSSITQIAQQIQSYNWTSMSLYPLDVNCGLMCGSLTWFTAISSINDVLRKMPATISSFELAHAIEQYFYTSCDDMDTTITVYSVANGQTRSLDVDIAVYRHQRAQIARTDTPWRFVVDTARIEIPLMMKTRLKFRIDQQQAQLKEFSVKDEIHFRAWRAPFVVGMLSGLVTGGDVHVRLQLPAGASLDMKMNISTDFGGDVKSTIIVDLLATQIDPMQVQVNTSEDKVFSPSAVLSNIRDGFVPLLGTALSGPLNLPLPPFSKSFGAVNDFTNMVSERFLWLNVPSYVDPLLALTNNIASHSIQAPLMFNVTINQELNLDCNIATLDNTDMNTLVNSINSGLSSCELGTYITARVQLQNSSDPTTGLIGLYATYYGIVWELSLNSPSIFGSYWTQQTIPVFGTWKDLSYTLSSVIDPSHRFTQPKFSTISSHAVPDLIPANLVDVYPDEIPVVALPLKLMNTEPLSMEMQSQLEGVETLSLTVEEGQLGGNLEMHMDANMIVAFELPPIGTGTIIILSCLSEANQTGVPVPESPYNTFTISIEAQLRSKDSVQYIRVSNAVTLTPGLPLLHALETELPSQVDPSVRSIVTIGVQEGIPSIGSVDQITIGVSRVQISDGLWLIPTTLAITESQLPYLFNASNSPPRTRILGSDVQMEVVTSAAAAASAANGFIGIIDAESRQVGGQSSIAVSIELNTEYEYLNSLVNATIDTNQFKNLFTTSIEVNNALDFSAIELPGGTLLGAKADDSHMQLSVNGKWVLDNDTDVKDVADELNVWSVSFKDSTILPNLVLLNTSSLCKWISQVASTTSEMSSLKASTSFLPFSTVSLGSLIEEGIGKLFQQANKAVCDPNQRLTRKLFCKVLQTIFGTDVCGHWSANETQLVIDISLVGFNKSNSNQFRFDTHRIFGGNLPVALGSSADFDMIASFEVQIELVADFTQNTISLSLSPSTTFTLSTEFDVNGKMTAFMGPLAVTFANMEADLGHPAMIKTKLTNHELSTTITGTAGTSASLSLMGVQLCDFSARVEDLGAFLNGNQGYTVTQKGDCLGALNDAIMKNTLFNFFLQDPSLFTQSFTLGMQNLLQRIFGVGGLFGDVMVPIVDRLIQEVLTKEIGNLVGPEITKQLVSGITDITNNILLHHDLSVNTTFIDEIVLTEFRNLLCKVFEKYLLSCPPVPPVNAPEYNFTLVFGQTTTHKLSNFKFHLGTHGVASLDVSSEENLVVVWNLTLTLSISKTAGVRLYFDHNPILVSDVQLRLSNCYITGQLGLLGADLSANGFLDGHMVVSQKFEPTFGVQAHVEASGDLGLAGPLKKKITDKDIKALPHWKAKVTFDWSWDFRMPYTTPTNFTVSDITMCVGTILGGVVKSTIGKVTHEVLDPMKKVLGPDGILLKKIHATSLIFGRDLNTIELAKVVYDHYCSGSCYFDHVLEAVNTFAQVYQVLLELDQVASWDEEGCGILLEVQSFIADFNKAVVNPEPIGTVPWPDLNFTTDTTRENQQAITRVWKTVTVEGQWGIKWHIMEQRKDIPKLIIELILGKQLNIPLVGLTIPKLTLGVGVSWHFPVWPTPPISIDVGISASVVVDVGEIVVLSGGIINAVKTRNPAKLVGALAIPTTNPDGTPHWPLLGTVRVSGGASVSVLIVKGSAYIFIELQGMVRLVDINGNGYCSFEELAWMLRHHNYNPWAVMDRKLVLTGGLGLSLKACIHYIIGHKCWKIAGKEWKATLFSEEWTPSPIPPIASATGTLNLDYVGQTSNSQQPMFRIYELPDGQRMHDYTQTDVAATMARTSPANQVLGVSGNPGNTQYTLQLQGISQAPYVALPSGNLMTLKLPAHSYSSSSVFQLSATALSMDKGGSSIAFSGCNQLQITEPLLGQSFQITGLPCSTTIESTITSNITLTGDMSAYKPLAFQGNAQNTVISLKAKKTTINSANVLMDNNLNIQIPVTQNLQIYANPSENSEFVVQSTPATQRTTLYGGEGIDTFTIPRLGSLAGVTLLDGGCEDEGPNELIVSMNAADGVNATISPYTLVQKGAQNFVLFNKHILNRQYSFVGAEGTHSEITLSSPEPESIISLKTIGAPNSSINVPITGCNGKSWINVTLTNGGNQTVVLGQNNQVSSFACTIIVLGSTSPNQVDTIIIEASAEDRPLLRWSVQLGYVQLADPNDGNKWFLLRFSEIERLIIHFGSHSNTLDVATGNPPTEYVFSFPEQVDSSVNKVRIQQSTDAILINGSCTVNVGPQTDETNPEDPLKSINGLIAVASSSQQVPVILNSGIGKLAPPQRYVMDDVCLDSALPNGTVIPMTSSPTSWMCSLLTELGHSCRNCHVSYSGNVTFSIVTGANGDSFNGSKVRVPVQVSLDAGDDVIIWETVHPAAVANFDVGVGADCMSFEVELSEVSLNLGNDRDVDVVDIWADNMQPPPQIKGNLIGPLGPKDTDMTTVFEWLKEDLIYLHRGRPTYNSCSKRL